MQCVSVKLCSSFFFATSIPVYMYLGSVGFLLTKCRRHVTLRCCLTLSRNLTVAKTITDMKTNTETKTKRLRFISIYSIYSGGMVCQSVTEAEYLYSLLLRRWYEIMALYYVKTILTEISASRQDRRVLQKSKIIRIEFLSKWGMLQTSRYV